MTRTKFLVAAIVAAFVTVGCGQGDPGSDDGSGTGSAGDGGSASDGDGGDGDTGATMDTGGGSDDTNSKYYPTVDGASWSYLHTGTDATGMPLTWMEEVTMAATDHEGRPAYLLADNLDTGGERTDAILAWQGTTVYRVHKDVYADTTPTVVVDYDPGFPRFDNAWLGLAEGTAEERVYQRTETAAAGGTPIVEDRIQRYTVESLADPVTVMAGSFDDCVRIRRERVEGVPRVKVFWFCAGVGKVKEVNETTLATEELVTYDVPEVGG